LPQGEEERIDWVRKFRFHLPTICMHFITKEIEIKGNYLRNNSWKP
jgi:hypothetical protein